MKTEELAAAVIQALCREGKTLSTAESCTGGGIGYALTAVPGSSAAYLGGVISYANGVKAQVLGVPGNVLKSHGAVSEQTARYMAQGVQSIVGSDLAVSVTGIAGPASDDTNKPVGLVYIGVCDGKEVQVHEHHFSGDRSQVRTLTIHAALQHVMDRMKG